jgi:acetyl esterase/lipase
MSSTPSEIPVTRRLFDIPYANLSPAQMLDIYWPLGGVGPFPVILAIHGGAFKFGDKRDRQLEPMLAGLARGYAVVSVNYRMSGEAIFPALVQDVFAAIRWVRAHATQYHFDAAKIATWGGSAGGYLSLMAGVGQGVPLFNDLSLGNPSQTGDVQAVVAWFPPTDFLAMDAQLAASGFAPDAESAHCAAHSPESLILGQQITEIPELVRVANPETYIGPGLPSFFIQHGDADSIVPFQQSVNFAAKMEVQKVSLEILPGAGHGDPAFQTPANIQKVLDFLDLHLSPGG